MVALAATTDDLNCFRHSVLVDYYVTTPVNTFVYQLIHSVINYQMEVLKVWALPGSLATTTGIIGYFLFHGVLRCFSSPGSLSLSYIFR